MLAFAGTLAAGLGIVGSMGLLIVCGVKFVNIVGVVPFLIIGKFYTTTTATTAVPPPPPPPPLSLSLSLSLALSRSHNFSIFQPEDGL